MDATVGLGRKRRGGTRIEVSKRDCHELCLGRVRLIEAEGDFCGQIRQCVRLPEQFPTRDDTLEFVYGRAIFQGHVEIDERIAALKIDRDAAGKLVRHNRSREGRG